MRRVIEIGVLQTHGTAVPASVGNVAAIQITGLGGNTKIYQR